MPQSEHEDKHVKCRMACEDHGRTLHLCPRVQAAKTQTLPIKAPWQTTQYQVVV